jgi:hypothetical protein
MIQKLSASNRFQRVTLLAVLVLTAGLCRAANSQTPDQRPTIRIRIYDYAAIPDPMFQQAAERAEQIFAPTGVRIAWSYCRTSMDDPRPGDPACSVPLGPTDIVLRLLTEKMARKMARQDKCAGYAIHTKDGMGAKAGVYIHRIIELERQTDAPRHAILGIFLAHEVGHLLLPDGRHSRDGVMRAWRSPETLFRAAFGEVGFTARQSKQIRANTERRANALLAAN